MPADPDRFRRRLARKLAEAGRRKVRRRVESASKTLARAMVVIPDSSPRRKLAIARIHIPHYWAVYVHDGRGPFRMRRGRFMVWWKNPKLDPRLRGGRSPRRAANLRRLTKAEFQAALEDRNAWIAAGGDPYDAPVVITSAIKRRTPPNKFFSNEPGGGMAGFRRGVVSRIAPPEMSRHVKDFLGDKFKTKKTLRIRL